MTASTRATANVANASLSTGPRTEEGKARSSRNAVKHGLTAKHLVIAPGEEEEFAELHDSVFEQLSPEGPLEMGLFNMYGGPVRAVRAGMKAFIDAPMPGRMQNEAKPDLDRLRQEMALAPRVK